MPSKLAKYGLKIFWVCDARIPYAINGIVYTGRQPGEDVQKNLGENIVQQLCGRFRNTGRNITMDNFFTSVPLAQHLLEKELTIVGTLCQNKPDIPTLMKLSKSREVYSTEFGFNDSLTMVSYDRKIGKAVVLLSTMHHDKAVDEHGKKKKTPEVIKFYNETNGGVDTIDQMVGNYPCKRQTQRWPMVQWSNIIEIGTLNVYTFFMAQHPDFKSGITNARLLFLKELSKELVTPYMSRLESCTQLQIPIIEAMKRCGVTKATTKTQERNTQGQPK
ncbi:piggyBac transposable element-derived protein 4-like [Hippocampus zosterae]|uniref:piggyBac transposable element-derived protein 4-like n=1 Tax=Hippocampus zosterae TaxID=109293 RepID=UPI00223D4537|nr:piggyBac transposable element-derived protein 4-like [Hippocampus zosterae]